MAEETPQINPVDPGPVPEPTSPWQTNGVFTEPSFTSDETPEVEATVEADATVDDAADVVTEPAEDAIAAEVGAESTDDNAVFLATLAKAMHNAATTERTRISEDTDRRSEAHIAGINARRDDEATRMRELADDDRRAVDAWVEEEQLRIAEERDRRNAAIESDLETSLAEHGAQVDGEIQRVEAAIAVYRQDVDDYFTKLEGDDPVAIAQQAGRRPAFPDLAKLAVVAEVAPDEPAVEEAVAEPERVEAVAEEVATADVVGDEPVAAEAEAEPAGEAPVEAATLIGVMEVDRPRTKLAQAWAAWNESTRTADEAAEAAKAAEVPPSFTLTPPTPAEGAAPADDAAVTAEAETPIAALDAETADDAQPEPTQIPVAAGTWKPPAEAPSESQSTMSAIGWFRRDRDRDHGGR